MRTLVMLVPSVADQANRPGLGRMAAGPLAQLKNDLEHLLAGPGLGFAWPAYTSSLRHADGKPLLTQEQSRQAEGEALAKSLLDHDVDRFVLVGHSLGCAILTSALDHLAGWAERGEGTTDPRTALRRITHVAQLGSPNREHGSAYVGASRTEPGQGVADLAFTKADVERWLPRCVGAWDEYVTPGDVIASADVGLSYADVLWRAATEDLDCGKNANDTTRRALALSQDGALAELVDQELDPATVVRTHEALLWPHVTGSPHDRYADLPAFEGVTAVQHAAHRIAQRLNPQRIL